MASGTQVSHNKWQICQRNSIGEHENKDKKGYLIETRLLESKDTPLGLTRCIQQQ